MVQEIVLAKYVELIFGTRTIFLDRLLSLVFIMGGFVVFVHCPALFDVDAFNNLFYMGIIKMAFGLKQPHPNPSYDILHVFRIVQNLVAADPRDMIYGLLGLGYASGFKADYTLSTEEVFRDFAIWCLRSGPNNLLVLSYAGFFGSASDWVSWVPQPYLNKTDPSFSEIPHLRASGGIIERRNKGFTENSWYLSGTNVLRLRGRFIDDVVNIANISLKANLVEARPELTDVINIAKCGITNLTNERYKKLCWAMTCEVDLWKRRALPEQVEWAHHCFQAILNEYRNEEEDQSVEEDFASIRMVHSRCFAHCQFCVTSNDRFAWVPKITQSNDKVCIILGANVPFVLRPRRDGQFVLVGECWIQGLMEGEALSLPGFEWEEISLV